MYTYWRISKPVGKKTATVSRYFPCTQLFENPLAGSAAKGNDHGL